MIHCNQPLGNTHLCCLSEPHQSSQYKHWWRSSSIDIVTLGRKKWKYLCFCSAGILTIKNREEKAGYLFLIAVLGNILPREVFPHNWLIFQFWRIHWTISWYPNVHNKTRTQKPYEYIFTESTISTADPTFWNVTTEDFILELKCPLISPHTFTKVGSKSKTHYIPLLLEQWDIIHLRMSFFLIEQSSVNSHFKADVLNIFFPLGGSHPWWGFIPDFDLCYDYSLLSDEMCNNTFEKWKVLSVCLALTDDNSISLDT